MKYINKPGDNLGGLIKIWAVLTSAFTTDNANVNFSDTSNIYEIYCSPSSKDFLEPSQETKSGTHYNTVIGGFIPHDDQSHQDAIKFMDKKKWAIIFIDGNEKYKLAGNVTDPLKFFAELSTGKDIASLAGYTFQFSGITKSRSIFINNPF